MNPCTAAATHALVAVHERHEAASKPVPHRGFVPDHPAARFGTATFGRPVEEMLSDDDLIVILPPVCPVPAGVPEICLTEPAFGLVAALAATAVARRIAR